VNPEEWPDRWVELANAYISRGGQASTPLVFPPAPESQILAVERSLRVTFPAPFHALLRDFAALAHFEWNLESMEEIPPPPLTDVIAGRLHWSLDEIPECEEIRRSWISDVFADASDPEHAIWHNKLAILHLDNGDELALDLATPGGAVVYLSHDGADLNGQVLGATFPDFIHRWTSIGCPGPEEWVIEPFVDRAAGGINPGGENARHWREWVGLPDDV